MGPVVAMEHLSEEPLEPAALPCQLGKDIDVAACTEDHLEGARKVRGRCEEGRTSSWQKFMLLTNSMDFKESLIFYGITLV